MAEPTRACEGPPSGEEGCRYWKDDECCVSPEPVHRKGFLYWCAGGKKLPAGGWPACSACKYHRGLTFAQCEYRPKICQRCGSLPQCQHGSGDGA